jgi:hypothetical protein
VNADQPGLGEQALGKAAEIGIKSQVDQAEEINVDVRANPLQLAQGEVESVAVSGVGVVIQQDLRMETLEVNAGKVSINPLSAAFGKIEFTQSTDADAEVVLTEADLNRALRSDYLGAKLQNLKVQLADQVVTVDIQQAELRLIDGGKLAFDAQVLQRETGEVGLLSIMAKPHLQDNGQRISLEDISETDRQTLPPEVAAALFQAAIDLLDLRQFELKGISLQLQNLDIQPGKMIAQARARVEQFPSF